MHRSLLALLVALPLSGQEVRETITVERILVDARVTKADGEPVTDLKPEDFRVKIDGKLARVASAEWVPETAGARALTELDKEKAATSLETPAPAGRLLIFFFQTDFAREQVRVRGQMKILHYADQLIDSLEPEDRVAVVSYDSKLKFRLDFSDDHERVRDVMREALLIDHPPRPPLVYSPSLSRILTPEALNATTSAEKALLLLGDALRPIPGPKSLILFGWGLGRLGGGRVHLGNDYAGAARALEQSRTAVFSIDITQADWHTLAVGIAQVAADTGGFYADTFHFPQVAIDKLQRTLQGHYELEVIRPPTKVTGVHTIQVDVVGRRGLDVMARSTFADK